MKSILYVLVMVLAVVSFANADSIDDVFWNGGTGDWMVQSNWTEDAGDGAAWAIPGWVSGNPYASGGEASNWNKGRAVIQSGTAQITPTSNPDGQIAFLYLGGTSGATLDISSDVTLWQGWIGYAAGDSGTINQNAGDVSIGSTSYFGNSGTGVYDLSGGSLSTKSLVLGKDASVSGTMTVSNNATFNTTGSIVTLGHNGQGQLNVSGNANVSLGSTGSVFLGRYAGSQGSIDVSGGSFGISTTGTGNEGIYIGRSGTGLLNQTGGTVNLSSAGRFVLGYYNNGTANITNGTLSANQAILGYTHEGVVGTLNMSGGQADISSDMFLGYYWPSGGTTETAAKGVVNLSGSGEINVGGNLYIGRSGNGEVNIEGGALNAAQHIYMSRYYGSTQPQASSLTISGGSLNVGDYLSSFGAKDVITISGSDATKISMPQLTVRSTLAVELDAGGSTLIEVTGLDTETYSGVWFIGAKLHIDTLPDYSGTVGSTYDIIWSATPIDINDLTVTLDIGTKHTFSCTVVDGAANGYGSGEVLRLTEIYGQCGDEFHPIPYGDVNGDCVVDYLDLKDMAGNWLECTLECP